MGEICCFAGHRDEIYNDEVYNRLKNTIENLITKENVTEFWVGNYGKFDSLSARAVNNVKEKYPHIVLNLIVPYLSTSFAEYKKLYEIYDNIIIADMPENTPIRYRILKCNQYMVKSSDFLVCFIKYMWGGCAKTLNYAKLQKNIKIFNLADKF